MSAVDDLLEKIPLPKMAKVAQRFQRPKVVNIHGVVNKEFEKTEVLKTLLPGSTVALAVGSRGISGLPELVRTVCDILKNHGFKPFIVPAMGSHGGATAEGQKELLAHLGVTEASACVPIRSSMQVKEISKSPIFGLPVYIDEEALSADSIIILNRVKAHPAFRATYESGLVKMAAIGLGKQRQAELVHNLGAERMGEYIEDIGFEAIRKIKLCAAVAVVENAFHEIAAAEVLSPEKIKSRERELLTYSRQLAARFILDSFDVLIIDEIGK